ncbi:MAG: TspO/MBR family protein [Rhodospirillaceae bacterium]
MTVPPNGLDGGSSGHGRSLLVLGGFIALVFAISAIGGAVTAGSVHTWYQTLIHPAFAPPDWVFAPVWSALYLSIAVAGWMVWRQVGFRGGRETFMFYGLQLALNLAWSLLFFGLHTIGAALIDVSLLVLAVYFTLRACYRIVPRAGLLLIPYLAWVSFAAVLNAAFWYLNL